MYLKKTNNIKSLKAKQKGNLIIVSLVIIIVLLTLGLALVKVLSGSAQQNTIEYYGARAFMAAQSGLERGLTQLFPLNNNAQNCSAVTNSITFTTRYLESCEVEVSCKQYLNLPDTSTRSGTVNIYYLQSKAVCSPNDCQLDDDCIKDYWQTQRTLSVEAKTLP